MEHVVFFAIYALLICFTKSESCSRRVFDVLDTDNNDVISLREKYGLFENDGDVDGDGQMDYIEFTDHPTLINTSYGCLMGQITEYGREFTNIPYAKAPTMNNSLRFKNPTIHDGWNDNIYDATGVAPSCMQDCTDKHGFGTTTCYTAENGTMSEDCLYLNVFTPYNNSDSLLETYPVMFFIHGGSYMHGWSGSALYSGAVLSNMNDVVVVTINYRLGAFGFLYNTDDGFEGNYGYQDQLFALKWVYQNIESFGGDKNKIVLFGQSAGAMSVGTILMDTSPDITKLYSGAIMESNPLGLPFRVTDSWDTIYNKFYEKADCSQASNVGDCLRGASSMKLLSAQKAANDDILDECDPLWDCYWLHAGSPWTPTFETNSLPQKQPLEGFLIGEFNKDVPIIIGTNKNEGIAFAFNILERVTGSYEEGLCGMFYDLMLYAIVGFKTGNKIKDTYKDEEPDCFLGDYRPLLAKVLTSLLFVCPTRNATQSISKNSNKNVWLYNYNYLYNNGTLIYGDDMEFCTKQSLDNVCHAAELPIVFQAESLPFTQKERDLSDLIQAFWTNVAKDGDPDLTTDPQWNSFSETAQWSMVFDLDNSQQMKDYDLIEYKCEFWDSLGYPWLYYQESQCDTDCKSYASRRRLFDLTICDRCDDEVDGVKMSSFIFTIYIVVIAILYVH